MIENKENIVSEILGNISNSFDIDRSVVINFIDFDRDLEEIVNGFISFGKERLSEPLIFEYFVSISKLLINKSEYANAAVILTELINIINAEGEFKNYLGEAYYNIGVLYFRQADWGKCEINLNSAIKIYTETADQLGKIKCKNLLGALKGEQGDLISAHEYFDQCNEFLDYQNDEYLSAMVNENLGILFNAQKKFEPALSYFNRSLIYFQRINDQQRLSEVRYNMALLFVYRREYEIAYREIDISLQIAEKIKYIPIYALLNLLKGWVTLLSGDLAASVSFLKEAKEICIKINDKMTLGDVYKLMGVYYFKRKEYELAEENLKESLKINEELKNQYNLSECHFEIGLLYSSQRRYEEAKRHLFDSLKYKKQINAVQDIESIEKMLSNLDPT